MLIRRKRSWEIPESEATPEAAFWNRRNLLKGAAAGSIVAGTGLAWELGSRSGGVTPPAAAAAEPDPTASLYPFKRNPRYTLDRPITPAKYSTTYNNFYEFGSSKDIWPVAQRLKTEPWTIKIDGMVEKEITIGFDDLLKKMPREERLYRHRCVETWAMAVPWDGFAMKAFVDFARPLGSAKYIRTQTFKDPNEAPGQNSFWYPWPYTEGLTMFEARNELAFLVTGMYGKPVPKQDGAPLRMAIPWKYGFKSAKSIVRFTFTDKEPKTFWATLGPTEYGFWANVNPAVPHPRWSQAQERMLGTDTLRPTLIWNGYGEYVAQMYAGIKGQELFR